VSGEYGIPNGFELRETSEASLAIEFTIREAASGFYTISIRVAFVLD